MTELLADKLQRLCCAETEGQFFDCVTGNISEIITALRTTPPTRDGAEGAGDIYRSENLGPQNGEPLCDGFEDAAPPKHAPDAMRNAVARYLCKLVRRFQTAAECGDDCVMCIDGSGTGYWQDEADRVLALAAPVPPADVESLRKALQVAAADIVGCCADPESEFVTAALKRISDARAGIPSPAVAAEPTSLQNMQTSPVKRDREAIARDLRNYANWTILSDESRELIEKAARELFPPRSTRCG